MVHDPVELPDEVVDYYRQAEAEGLQDARGQDPVIQNIGYRYFTSRSKGIRNGKQRIRRRWKEVELIRYQSGWQSPHRAKLDEVATEVTHGRMGDDELLWHIRENCERNAGSMTPRGVV